MDLGLSTTKIRLGGRRAIRFMLKLNDVTNATWVEPGWDGVEAPNLGINVWLMTELML